MPSAPLLIRISPRHASSSPCAQVANGGNYPPDLCDATTSLLAKKAESRMTLKKLISQLNAQPSIEELAAQWGLSKEAAAAMAAVSIS